MKRPAVLGLDLSICATGIAYADGATRTVAPRLTGDERLLGIWAEVEEAARIPDSDLSDPDWVDLAVIEDLPTHARAAGITGMVHGAVRTLLLGLDVPYALVPPATLKKYATGKGNATKADMRMALYQRAGIDERDDNRVDAFWLRAMGLDHLGHPPVELPKTHRAALEKVAWPACGLTYEQAVPEPNRSNT